MTSLIPITPPDQFASHILQLHTAVDEEQPGMVNEIGSLFCDPRICLRLTCSNKLLGFFSHFVGDGGPPGPQQQRGVRTRRHLGAPALQQFEEFVQDIRHDPLIVRCSVRSLKRPDRKSTRLNSSHQIISYAVFCLKKKKKKKSNNMHSYNINIYDRK